jgi:hypothetical protein
LRKSDSRASPELQRLQTTLSSSSITLPSFQSDTRARVWLALMFVVGVALLCQDSYQQDGPAHYVFARQAWRYPANFVNVWARPLFTFLYAFPALLGYTSAKLFTVIICAATAWQTWRLAQQLLLRRAEMVIPFLFLQPSFLLLCADTMTEPLFALTLALALRLYLRGKLMAGMLTASLLPLVRPEGFFICALWGGWFLFDRRDTRSLPQRLPITLILLSGTYLWAFAALWIKNDPLWLLSNWPRDWNPAGGQNGSGGVWWYFHKSSYIFGWALKAPFVVGLIALVWRRRFLTGVSAFALIFTLHALMFVRGTFGAAGYPRYFVTVSPLIALITLAGWNVMAEWLERSWRPAGALVLTLLLVINGLHALHYVDGWGTTRDARAINEMAAWFRRHAASAHPVKNFLWSHAYMCVVFDRGAAEKEFLSGDREANLSYLRYAPPGTLFFWDDEIGVNWHKLTPADFEAAGYLRLRSQQYRLDGWFFSRRWKAHGGPRWQTLHLFYKPLPEAPAG